ncbi:PREDICTED: butyrophilin-like protein 2 [Condylura cristata]|uniref:butyrophilin-like protein 2 n=1 Tax=Condylura cristata TaxID=143302 RepID=UPI000643AE61|nr:PREDICTED: butyrophilin-like protein 2 [Condylura cristata]
MVDVPGLSVSGLFASVFFVLLFTKPPDEFKVIGPAHPTVARLGEDAILPCWLLPKRTAKPMEVTWYRSEPSTQVLALQDGAEVTEMQLEEYRGRVRCIQDDIAEGRVALKIDNVQPSDNGQYWCRFQEGYYIGETSFLLKVAGLGSSPDIHMEGSAGSAAQVVCTAKGWFPEPQVYWEDVTGERLLTLSEHHIQDEDGLFYVEASLMVNAASVGTVSCFIHNHILTEEKSSAISIPEKLQNELASLKVTGPSEPILVRVGEDIQLNCSLTPRANAQSMEVRWVRSHRYPAVYVYMDGDYVAGEQMAEYRGRTALVTKALDEGTVTLQIQEARTSDDGWYRCLFEKDGVYQEASLDVKIIAVGSSPRITMEGLEEGGSQLVCTSEGWFPQPHVQWRDQKGETVHLSSEVLTQDSHGLFQVETRLVLKDRSVVNMTCSISNPLIGEEKMTTFLSSAIVTTIMVLVIVIIVVLILPKIYKRYGMPGLWGWCLPVSDK